MGSLMLRRVAVQSELRWKILVATMTGNRWPVEDSVDASLAYFSRGARRQSRSCLLLACVVDCWNVARSPDGGAQCGRVP
jgi:hypothetical protein